MNLSDELKAELEKRPFNQFTGVAPFKRGLKHEFQRSRNIHFTRSQFCSGERQRIIKYILQHELVEKANQEGELDEKGDVKKVPHFGGFDMVDSKTTTPAAAEKYLVKAHLDHVIDKQKDDWGWKGTVDDEIDKTASKSRQDSMFYMAKTILADEIRDNGQLGEREKDKIEENIYKEQKRMKELLSYSSHELRALCRTWPIVDEYFPLHDNHELAFLIKTWATPTVFSNAWFGFSLFFCDFQSENAEIAPLFRAFY